MSIFLVRWLVSSLWICWGFQKPLLSPITSGKASAVVVRRRHEDKHRTQLASASQEAEKQSSFPTEGGLGWIQKSLHVRNLASNLTSSKAPLQELSSPESQEIAGQQWQSGESRRLLQLSNGVMVVPKLPATCFWQGCVLVLLRAGLVEGWQCNGIQCRHVQHTPWKHSGTENASWQEVSWQDSAWRQTSPRRKSPRRRRPKASGVAGGEAGQAAAAPSAKALPQPPVQIVPAGPKTGPAAASGANPERAALDQILQAMRSQQEELPPQLRDLLVQHGRKDTEAEAKTLHKLVTTQAQRKKELLKLRMARANYAKSWATYVGQVASTIQQQAEEHAETMQNFASKEAQWEKSLMETAKELKSRAKEDQDCVVVSSEEEEDGSDVMLADLATTETNAEKLVHKQQEQLHALQAALQAAQQHADEQVADFSRERTPRRSKEVSEAGTTTALPPQVAS